MPFRPLISSKIAISGIEYSFTEHPSARGMPYGQTGRRATVYQVRNGSDFHALKVFTKAFRTVQTETSAQRIQAYANLPSLQVCSRVVVTHKNNREMVEQYPDLEYAVLMPWVNGQTWQEIVLSKQPLTTEQSLSLAHHFVSILANMEQKKLAHCDLSGPNVMVADLLGANGNQPLTALVDVEDLHASELEKPAKLPAGTPGYNHRTDSAGLWSAEADRFAGTILIAEMLAWYDERVRRIAAGEQYFDPLEMQQGSDRFNLLKDILEKRYGHLYSEALTQVWFSQSPNGCPRLADWLVIMENGSLSSPQPEAPRPAELTDAARYLFDSFKDKIVKNNFAEAEKLVNALRALAPDFDEPAQMLAQARTNAEQERAKREELTRLEHELAREYTFIQNIQAEIGRLQAELREHEQARSQIENTIKQYPIATVVASEVQQDVFTSTQSIAPNPETPIISPNAPLIAMPSNFPSYGGASARISQNCYIKHMPVPGQSSFFAFQKQFVTISTDKMTPLQKRVDIFYPNTLLRMAKL